MIFLVLFLMALVGVFYGWRYSTTDADPDWSLFNLPAFTGSWYGRDFADCKTPLVYLWYFGIAKIVGAKVERVKFAHHLLISMFGVGYTVITYDIAGGLAFIVLVNSGWLLSFHGNVGAVPAGLLLLALVSSPWVGAALVVLAFLYEPKLLLSGLALMFIRGWYAPLFFYTLSGLFGMMVLRLTWEQGFEWVFESSVVIPARMQKNRKIGFRWSPWFTSNGMLYLLPWLIFAVFARPDILYWIPPAIYFVLIGLGRVVRQNHFIPLAAWIAAAGIAPQHIMALVAVDWVSAGFYFGDIWMRFYPALRQPDAEAKAAGEKIKDLPGILWVNGIFSAVVHLYSGKPVPYGMNEQVEIREVTDRRTAMKQAFKARPPDFVVTTDAPALQFTGVGYKVVGKGATTGIWRRV